MSCNCEPKKYNISLGCCVPVLGPIEQYYTKYQIDKMLAEIESGITSGCCITPEEVDEKIDEAISGITPCDLSEYWTSAQTESAITSAITYVEGEIPSLSGYATEEFVSGYTYDKETIDEKIASGGTFDPTQYYTTANTYNKTEVNNIITSAITDVEGEIPSLSGYATEQWVENKNYLTEHQPLKTINGYTISGTGNIEITASGGSISIDSELSLESVNPVENKVITEALNDKLDASAYTPVDLSEYWTSAQTQSAITEATSGKLDASAYTPIDLSIYATTSWVNNQNYVSNSELIQYITNLQNQIDSLTELISGCCSSSGETEYRWITMTGDNDYTCSGTTKYTKEKEQSSTDGINWTDTGNYRSGDTVLEENSVDCGYVPTPMANCDQYFTIKANGNGAIRLSTRKLPQEYQYSKDSGNTWSTIRNDDSTQPIFIQMTSGESVMFKGELITSETYAAVGVAQITTTIPSYEARGNIMSLIYGDNFSGQTSLSGRSYVFVRMFVNCSGLTSAENLCLPATTLSNSCYGGMFMGCSNLTTAPSTLPATTLADYCYQDMFSDCTSLTSVPQLSAPTLEKGCYAYMFAGCTSLNNIKCLATDISANNCTYDWVDGVASGGTFTKAASMNDWASGASGIPSNWTVYNE